jgi:hypothetical protein
MGDLRFGERRGNLGGMNADEAIRRREGRVVDERTEIRAGRAEEGGQGESMRGLRENESRTRLTRFCVSAAISLSDLLFAPDCVC